MSAGADLVAAAMPYAGLPYRLGAEAALPRNIGEGVPFPTALDCSELVQLACAHVGIDAPDGTVNQYPWARHVTVDEAIGTAGALLFVWVGPNSGGGAGNHVAISRGDGTTIEARGTRYGVGVFPAPGRFNEGALVPGIDYTTARPSDEETDDMPLYVQYHGAIFRIVGNTVQTLTPDGWELDQALTALGGKPPIAVVTDEHVARTLLEGRLDSRTGHGIDV